VKRRILVRITATGETSVEADGFHGNGCEAATRAIEEALGKPVRRKRKPDFWRRVLRLPQQQPLQDSDS
jgi:hypothetical protein